MLKSGATIDELNSVRKHLSAIKGGRLAQAAYPALMATLILSDVIGNPLDVIASGPTAQDRSSFADALAVIEKYGLQEKIPVRAMSYLQRGLAGQETETVKDGDPCLEATLNVIVGDINLALQAAAEKARQLGYATEIANAKLQGEARNIARLLAEGGVESGLQSGGAFPNISARPIRMSEEIHPNRLGQQIARSVYGGIGESKSEQKIKA